MSRNSSPKTSYEGDHYWSVLCSTWPPPISGAIKVHFFSQKNLIFQNMKKNINDEKTRLITMRSKPIMLSLCGGVVGGVCTVIYVSKPSPNDLDWTVRLDWSLINMQMTMRREHSSKHIS